MGLVHSALSRVLLKLKIEIKEEWTTRQCMTAMKRAVNDGEKADKLETATAAQNEGVLLYNRESKAQRGSRQCTDLWESFYLRQSSSPAGANTHLGNMLKYP